MTEQTIPIYSGNLDDFHWVGFGTGSGTNLNACAKVIKPSLIFSNRAKENPKAGLFQQPQLLEERGIIHESIKAIDITGFRPKDGDPDKLAAYEKKCIEYDQMIVDMLHRYEESLGYSFDLIVLGGYMRLINAPLLEAYKDRIINVHPADLGILVVDSENAEKYIRKYIGDKAVYNALKAGEEVVRSSVIMVDEGEDHGEILTQGPELEVWHEFLEGTDAERQECIDEYADGFQSFLKVRSDWSALTNALEKIANGRIALGTENIHHNEWRGVYIDDKLMLYEGFQVVPGGE